MSQQGLQSSTLSDVLLSDPLDPPSSETDITLPSDPPQRPQTWDDVPQTYKVGDNAVHLMPRVGITRGWFWDYGFKVRRKEDSPQGYSLALQGLILCKETTEGSLYPPCLESRERVQASGSSTQDLLERPRPSRQVQDEEAGPLPAAFNRCLYEETKSRRSL